jgi:predicted site-specific integrase-resolvase
MSERELTAAAAAKRLGMRAQTFRALCDEGQIEHRVVQGVFRRRVYVPVREVERIRESQRKAKIYGR